MKTAALCLALLLVGSAWAGPDVTHLTSKNFKDVTSDGKVYFIKFYAPWCGHCKRMAPAWSKLAASYESNPHVKVVSVDCTKDRKVCDKAKVPGFPSLRVYYDGVEKATYKGPREEAPLRAFLDEQAALLLRDASDL